MTDTTVEEGGHSKFLRFKYPAMRKTLGNFKLHVDEGNFTDSEIIVMLGENGTGGLPFLRKSPFASSFDSFFF